MKNFLIFISTSTLLYSQITVNNVNPNSKQGNGTKFQLAMPYTGAIGQTVCADASGNITTAGCKTLPLVFANDYHYAAQIPGGNLIGGVSAVINLNPCPKGVVASDTRLRMWITGGVGTSEPVQSNGMGSCTGDGITAGTVRFTPSFNHSGLWNLSSATLGVYEAFVYNPGARVMLANGVYNMHDGISYPPNKPIYLQGTGAGSTATTSFLNFGGVTNGHAGISIIDTAFNSNEPKIFQDFTMQGTGTTTGGHGVELTKVVRTIFEDVQINSFALSGVYMIDTFETSIAGGTAIFYNAQWGVSMVGVSNLNSIVRSYVGNNSRSNGFGSVLVIGTDAANHTQSLTFDGVDFSNSGRTPFTTVTTAYGLLAQFVTGLTIVNSYNEGNITNAELIQGGSSSINKFNNWYANANIVYSSDVFTVHDWGNTFLGAAAFRSISNPDTSKYIIGPDNCIFGSTECVIHPQMGGLPTYASFTFATLPSRPNGSIVFCSDCNSTCSAGASAGRMCFREAGAWTR